MTEQPDVIDRCLICGHGATAHSNHNNDPYCITCGTPYRHEYRPTPTLNDTDLVTVDTRNGPIRAPQHAIDAWNQYGWPHPGILEAMAEEVRDAKHAEEARIKADLIANHPDWARDFDRTTCWPDCKPDKGHWGHTRNLGFCTEAHRPKTTALGVFVDLEARLEERESQRCEGGLDSSEAADLALLWLADHPEVIQRIWPGHGYLLLDQTHDRPEQHDGKEWLDLRKATERLAAAEAAIERVRETAERIRRFPTPENTGPMYADLITRALDGDAPKETTT